MLPKGIRFIFISLLQSPPKINVYRVALRVKQGGHNVPSEKIRKRYFLSLGLLYEAAELAYQSFFFDNSKDNEPFELIAHFKKQGNKKIWSKIDKKKTTRWFRKYDTEK